MYNTITMKKLEITKGEWKKGRKTKYYQFIGTCDWGEFIRVVRKIKGYPPAFQSEKLEAKSNIKLIIDAGNTYQECELLPSELLRWKKEQMTVTGPLFDFMHGHQDLKPGNSIIQKSIEFIKERDELLKQNKELRLALENVYQGFKLAVSDNGLKGFNNFLAEAEQALKP